MSDTTTPELIIIGRATDEEFDEYSRLTTAIPGLLGYTMILPMEALTDKLALAMMNVQIDVAKICSDMVVVFTHGDNDDYVMTWVVV